MRLDLPPPQAVPVNNLETGRFQGGDAEKRVFTGQILNKLRQVEVSVANDKRVALSLADS